MNQANVFANNAQQLQQQPVTSNNNNEFSYPNIGNPVYVNNDIYAMQYNVADTNVNSSVPLPSSSLPLTANSSAEEWANNYVQPAPDATAQRTTDVYVDNNNNNP